MIKRLTRTEYYWANNQVIGSYLVPIVPSPEEMEKHFSNVLIFHYDYMLWIKQEMDNHADTEKLTKVWQAFYINIPLTAIETNMNYSNFGLVTDLIEDIKTTEIYYKNVITQINKSPLSMDSYQIVLDKANKKLCSLLEPVVIIKPEDDFTREEFILIVRYYMTLFPLLQLLKILYYNVIFNKYLLSIHNIKPQDLASTSYTFIQSYFHLDCKNKDPVFKTMFYNQFQTLKDLKNISGIPLLDYKQKQELFKFIVYLKTYTKLVSEDEMKVYDKWPIYHSRETKRYFHKFFGNKANFSSYLLSNPAND